MYKILITNALRHLHWLLKLALLTITNFTLANTNLILYTCINKSLFGDNKQTN